MYRIILPFLLYVSAGAAPQNGDTNSQITYIKMQPQNQELETAPSIRTSRIENLPLTVPGNTTDSFASSNDTDSDDSGNFESAETTTDYTTETVEVTTEKYIKPEVKTKAPRFYSKLSYFEKPNYESVATNLVERAGRRKFRSKCRCERISNCPKLQITVPRCPNEYFMCCF